METGVRAEALRLSEHRTPLFSLDRANTECPVINEAPDGQWLRSTEILCAVDSG